MVDSTAKKHFFIRCIMKESKVKALTYGRKIDADIKHGAFITAQQLFFYATRRKVGGRFFRFPIWSCALLRKRQNRAYSFAYE